ncbi:MAG: RDD family protein [Acidobacteriota bacterium]|nr:RDD family protein [Acidobacteriota bacterium]
MNQRVAAHRNRKTTSAAEAGALFETSHSASSRAAQAAARVAARYAKAPSYSEMLAGEARAVAAGSAPEPEARAASVADQAWEPPAEHSLPHHPSASPVIERQSLGIRWEPDFPVREAPPAAARATHEPVFRQMREEEWLEPASQALEVLDSDEIEVVEPAQPIHANLIEFPRELVATRKVRPRRAAGPGVDAAEPGMQLSIFEVDPSTISMHPAAVADSVFVPAPAWPASQWSAIELEELPQDEAVAAVQAPAASDLHPVPFNLRLMAHLVDGSLIVLAFLAAVLASVNPGDLPGLREIELGAAGALVVAVGLYHALFFTLAKATPGMRYAHIRLCTFEDEIPTRAQRWTRLGALLLSLLPVGLGLVWAIFDDDHLTWHDRLSRTYLRRY